MPTTAEFLTPVLALVCWTLVVWAWMYATRIPAMKQAGIDPQEAAYPGTWSHRLRPGVRSVAVFPVSAGMPSAVSLAGWYWLMRRRRACFTSRSLADSATPSAA